MDAGSSSGERKSLDGDFDLEEIFTHFIDQDLKQPPQPTSLFISNGAVLESEAENIEARNNNNSMVNAPTVTRLDMLLSGDSLVGAQEICHQINPNNEQQHSMYLNSAAQSLSDQLSQLSTNINDLQTLISSALPSSLSTPQYKITETSNMLNSQFFHFETPVSEISETPNMPNSQYSISDIPTSSQHYNPQPLQTFSFLSLPNWSSHQQNVYQNAIPSNLTGTKEFATLRRSVNVYRVIKEMVKKNKNNAFNQRITNFSQTANQPVSEAYFCVSKPYPTKPQSYPCLVASTTNSSPLRQRHNYEPGTPSFAGFRMEPANNQQNARSSNVQRLNSNRQVDEGMTPVNNNDSRINSGSLYDQTYEEIGLPLDPHLRILNRKGWF